MKSAKLRDHAHGAAALARIGLNAPPPPVPLALSHVPEPEWDRAWWSLVKFGMWLTQSEDQAVELRHTAIVVLLDGRRPWDPAREPYVPFDQHALGVVRSMLSNNRRAERRRAAREATGASESETSKATGAPYAENDTEEADGTPDAPHETTPERSLGVAQRRDVARKVLCAVRDELTKRGNTLGARVTEHMLEGTDDCDTLADLLNAPTAKIWDEKRRIQRFAKATYLKLFPNLDPESL